MQLLAEQAFDLQADSLECMASKETYLVHSARSNLTSSMESDQGRGAWRSGANNQGTVVSSIFILLTTCVGAGTLSLPYAFSQGGIFVFSIIFFLVMVSSAYRQGCIALVWKFV